jgi:enoyl-CoA hydratase/carnithine racemase
MPEYKNWLLEEKDHVATLTLNRPESMNSLDMQTLLELEQVSADLGERTNIRVVILQGRGAHFSTGMDPNIIREQFDQPEHSIRAYIKRQQECLDTFETLKIPTIARLHGFCYGGGLLMALCCDFRIASQRTIFSFPEVRLGIPFLWGTQRLTRLSGIAVTKELLLLARRYRASEIETFGLIHKVVPPQDLDNAILSVTKRLLLMPPLTMGIVNQTIHQGCELSFQDSQDLELDFLSELLDSSDMHEAMQSYLEKRQPDYSGK